MKVLIFGGTGGCGSQVLTRLIERNTQTTAVVRDVSRLPAGVSENSVLKVVVTPDGHLSLSQQELVDLITGCDVVVSALGHRMSCSGMFGRPRNLCEETVRRVCNAISTIQPTKPIKFIIMSTEGVSRLDGSDPKRGCCESCLVNCCLKLFLPPHSDNLKVLRYLHDHVENEKNRYVTFCAVRPSDMRNGEQCEYTIHKTLQNGIFNAGNSTRANVGNFMADLVTDSSVWEEYKDSYPQILDVKDTKKPSTCSSRCGMHQDFHHEILKVNVMLQLARCRSGLVFFLFHIFIAVGRKPPVVPVEDETEHDGELEDYTHYW
eukprot:gene875-388_t